MPACSLEECDLFDFMAHYVGMTVLHPGGLWATDRQARLCHIDKDSRVLDIACGKGTSAIYLARKYGSHIVGVDLDAGFVDQATRLAEKKGLGNRLDFRTADALHLPFGDNEFDVTLSQAFLVLIPDQERAVREAVRVTRPGGYIAWLELSFTREPPPSLFERAAASACEGCFRHTLTFEGWERLFRESGMADLQTVPGEMGTRQRRMFRDEGWLNAARIMWKWATNPRIRRRMDAIFGFFRDHSDFIRYGIFVGRKPETVQ